MRAALAKDISREGFTPEKALHQIRLLRPKNNHAIAKVSSFQRINIDRINQLLGTNFKGVILDIDECVAPHHGEILTENMEAIVHMVKSKIKLVIFSNMEATNRYDPLIKKVFYETGYEIKVITSRFAKPDPRGFMEAKEALALQEGEEAVMIGDNFCTDGGSIRIGIPFIKVDPIKTKEKFLKKAKRLPQTATRKFHAGVSNFYDRVGKRKVLRDRDLPLQSFGQGYSNAA